MNKLLTFISLVILFFSCKEEKPILTFFEPEEMGKELFEAIQTKEVNTIVNYLATSKDIEERLSNAILSERNKEKKIKKYTKNIETIKENVSSRLDELHQNKNFKNTIYKGITYKNYQKDSITLADISLVYLNDRVKHKIKLKGCYLTSRGWVVYKGITFKKAK